MARKRVRRRPTCSKHGRSTRVGKSAKARTAGARGLNACRHHPERYKVKANAGTSVRVTSNRQKGEGIYRYRALKVVVDGPSGFRTYEILTDPYYNMGGGSYTDVWRDIPEPESVQQAIYDAVRAKRSGRRTKANGRKRVAGGRRAKVQAARSTATVQKWKLVDDWGGNVLSRHATKGAATAAMNRAQSRFRRENGGTTYGSFRVVPANATWQWIEDQNRTDWR